jgi:hypothetical protein
MNLCNEDVYAILKASGDMEFVETAAILETLVSAIVELSQKVELSDLADLLVVGKALSAKIPQLSTKPTEKLDTLLALRDKLRPIQPWQKS